VVDVLPDTNTLIDHVAAEAQSMFSCIALVNKHSSLIVIVRISDICPAMMDFKRSESVTIDEIHALHSQMPRFLNP
jgi:hypothetical protein